MSKRVKNKDFTRNVRPRQTRTSTFEDIKESFRNKPDVNSVPVAVNELCKIITSHTGTTAKAQKQKLKSNKQKYAISDSSDEDFVESVTSNNPSSVSTIFRISKDTEKNCNTPSTSDVSSDTTNFVDDLLKTNKELLNGSYTKSYDELCKETDQLLASSLELFNANNPTSFEDSMVFVCTDKDTTKSCAPPSPIQSATENVKCNSGQKCPICLDTLGGDLPAWSTYCGHVFCKNCISNWIVSQKNCPTCRKRLTIKKIHQLFF